MMKIYERHIRGTRQYEEPTRRPRPRLCKTTQWGVGCALCTNVKSRIKNFISVLVYPARKPSERVLASYRHYFAPVLRRNIVCLGVGNDVNVLWD